MSHVDMKAVLAVQYAAAARAYKRLPHNAAPMLSLNSTPPIRQWYCEVCYEMGAEEIMYSTSSLAPVCNGGKEFI